MSTVSHRILNIAYRLYDIVKQLTDGMTMIDALTFLAVLQGILFVQKVRKGTL